MTATSTLRILLADDHDAFLEGVRRLLEREGFEVVGAVSNGREALRLARELQPDVAVLDLSMPVLDGFETARAIAGACPETKLVALTGHSDPPYVSRALRVGFAGYVLKPRAAEELVHAIRVVHQGLTHLPQGFWTRRQGSVSR